MAVEPYVAGDPDLPQPVDGQFAEGLIANSPFSRYVSLEDSLQLTSIAYVDGRPVATVYNKMTKETVLVFEEPNALGWRLTGAVAGTDLINTQIEMTVGPESITMHYHGQEVSPQGGKKEGKMSRLAGGGVPNKDSKLSTTSLLGKDGKKLYSSLSPEARGQFKSLVKSQLDKQPNMTPEQSSSYAKKVLARIQGTDRSSTGAATKSPKAAKPAKKKQGA
ncbi:hypothetical protein [Prosthecobacter sp. SYSU 5D2]|uniref:hypothetical protein n=1 Tax=Prosthecobacter sp. SYSU 5D2 TaxID=3134134 RepID=UPI0031FF24A4